MKTPSGWKMCKLGQLVTIESGDSPALFDLKSQGVCPFVKVEDLNNCAKYQTNARQFADSSSGLVRVGSVIFPKRGASISTNKVRIAATPLLMDSNMMAIFADEAHLTSEFLYYTILFEKLYRIADTSTIPQINNKHIIPYAVHVPPVTEQRHIATMLGTSDMAVDRLHGLLAAKRELRTWLMQQLLTGQKRFKEFQGEWRHCHLGEVVQSVSRPVVWNEKELYRLASVRRWSGGLFSREELYGHQIKVKKLQTIRTGDFLISHIQAAYGAMAMVNEEFDGAKVSELYTLLRPRDKAFDIRYLGYLGQTKRMWHKAIVASNGFFAERLRLNFDPDEFLRLPVTVPPTLDEQTRIVDVLSACDREIELLQKQLAALKEQKRGLMQKLLTGEVRVRV